MRELRIDVRGLGLHALERGEGPLAVLLHGWLDHARSFDALAPLLPGRTVALDWRGHGESDWVGPGGFYHFIDYVAELDGVLAQLQPEGKVRIVGHSMGAGVGLLYAAARPGRVAHLTLLDGWPLSIAPAEVPERLAAWLADLEKPRTRRTVEGVDDAAGRLRRFNPALSEAAARTLAAGGVGPDAAQEGRPAWRWDPLLRAHSPLPITEEVLRELLAPVRTPVLALRAAKGVMPQEGELRARCPDLPLEVHTVEGTGHHLHLDAPGEVARLVRAAWERAQ